VPACIKLTFGIAGECSDFDFKCAFGFSRKEAVGQLGVPCTRDFDAPCDPQMSSSQLVSVYERIPGDKCQSHSGDKKWTNKYKFESCLTQASGTFGAEVASAVGYLMMFTIIFVLLATVTLTVSGAAGDALPSSLHGRLLVCFL
jgi:hypothetical protein